MKLNKHFPWLIFACVLAVCLSFLETHGLDEHAREVAEITETKTAWVEKQTRVMEMGSLSHLSSLQKALKATRDPGSVREMD